MDKMGYKFHTPSGQTVRPGEKRKVVINVKERRVSRRGVKNSLGLENALRPRAWREVATSCVHQSDVLTVQF